MKQRRFFTHPAAVAGFLLLFTGASAQPPGSTTDDAAAAAMAGKILNRFTGGRDLSASDSAAVIKSYTTAEGGPGLHFEYSVTTTGKKGSTGVDTARHYFTESGEGRMERRLPIPGVKTNQIIVIGRSNMTGCSILLHPDEKSYALNITDTAIWQRLGKYQVTRVGAETVAGYACIHSKATSTSGAGRFRSEVTTDIWTSTAVPGYAIYKKMMGLETAQTGLNRALDAAGCGGFIVKTAVSSDDYSATTLLIKAETEKLSADLFRIPQGYSLSDENMVSTMMRGVPH